MNAKVLGSLIALVCLDVVLFCGATWALDEAILTPTAECSATGIAAAGSKQDRGDAESEFSAAMSVWLKHRYADGERLLGDFAKKYPDSKWRAEAELHQGCYLTYLGRTAEAKPLFQRLASEFANTNIKTKAQLRLANIAEREVRTDDAIAQYAAVLRENPTWDQFKYANYRARKLMMTRGKQEARINCGPVALAACLDAIGRKPEAIAARGIRLTTDGMSLSALEARCATYSVPAKAIEMTLDDLQSATPPVLAYVEPKHFIAVLSIKDGKAQVEDSIRGKYEMSLDDLSRIWAGRVLTFAPSDKTKPLALIASLETTGGCCGQIDEDECLGDPCDCQQSSGGSGGGGGCGFGDGETPTAGSAYGPGCVDRITDPDWNPTSAGRPRWQVNVDNLNILVKDTPIFYRPGKGPMIPFTLTYSNENSNTGIFGRGWRSPFDMKVFFLPSSYQDHPTLQVHRQSGRIETYEWNGSAYAPRSSTANYGYRDTIEKQTNGTVVLSLRAGGKYYFMPEGGSAEGRIHIIEDAAGNQVTCGYDTNGCLSTVTDANGGVTSIITEGTGLSERVTNIRIPRYVNGAWVLWENDAPADRRQAVLDYTDGNLVYIEDMLGDHSHLAYNAMLFYTAQASSTSTTSQAITTASPANGEAIQVGSTDGFFSSGKIRINNNEEITYTGKTVTSFTGITRGATPTAADSGSPVAQVVPTTSLSAAIDSISTADLVVADNTTFPSSGGWIAIVGGNGTETLRYTGKSGTTLLTGITRGQPAYAASASSSVYLCSQSPYLSEIVTPSKKSKFSYEWYDFVPYVPPVVGLHMVYECGPTESYPELPTIHYAWCPYQTAETRYPTTVHDSTTDRCNWGTGHWTGGLKKTYDYSAFYDASTYILDELGNYVVQYGYNDKRDRTSVTDASGNTTQYYYTQNKNTYDGDGKHDMYFRHDPLGNEWTYTYYDDHSLHTESDAYGRTVKTYTYNSAGQVTQIDTPLGTQSINHYDSQGRVDYITDARGKTTHYYYDAQVEPRGFLTSVVDPENKTTTYHYDSYGRRDQVTDPSSVVTRYEHDKLDRVTKVIHGSGSTDPYTQTEYTCCHKVYDQDENGRRTYYVYDAKVRPYKTITSAKSTTLAAGITEMVPANTGSLAVASLDGMPTSGKVVVFDEIISYTGTDTQGGVHYLTGITRGADSTRCVEADAGFAVGRVDAVPATYGYDQDVYEDSVLVHRAIEDRMVSLTDALNHTTYYTYYLNGKAETIRYPDSKGERYSYDGFGSGPNMIKKEYGTFTGTYPDQTFTPNGDLTVNYEYDANNRLLRSYH